jgi:hypothetical protein
MEFVEYLDETGRSPFGNWFNALAAQPAAKVAAALAKLERGATSNVRGWVAAYRNITSTLGRAIASISGAMAMR